MSNFWRVQYNWGSYKTPIQDGRFFSSRNLIDEPDQFSPSEMHLTFARKGPREDRMVGDFTLWNAAAMTLSRKAFDCLEFFLEGCGRSFQIDIGPRPYVIVLLERSHDAFDRNRSHFRRLNGEQDFIGCQDRIPGGSSLKVVRMVLKPDFRTTDHVFRLNGELPLQLETIVSREFYQAYQDHNLTGLIFQPVDQ